ncbi:MAG: hypothetical protein ACJ782_10435 [Actinomycetota bacterium]
MTERYGSGYGDKGQRPSGRGAVTERLARQGGDADEIDLTDEAARRDQGEDSVDDPAAAWVPLAVEAAAGSGRPGGAEAPADGSADGTGVGVMSADAGAVSPGSWRGSPGSVTVVSPCGSGGSASVSATGGS